VWIKQEQVDKWAFEYCHKVKDDPEIWPMIQGSRHAFLYCKYIKNRPEVRQLITESEFAAFYCEDISDDDDMRSRIIEKRWLYYYYYFVVKDPAKAKEYAGVYPDLLKKVADRIVEV
jgi:hypothetical protein